MSAAVFVAAARQLVGQPVKWRHRGRQPWALDCIGLLMVAFKPCDATTIKGGEAGRADVTGYGREPWDGLLCRTLGERFGEPVTDWRPGDIAVIRWGHGEPSHVGILGDHPTAGLSLLHMHNLHGICEQGLVGPVRASIVQVYRPWLA